VEILEITYMRYNRTDVLTMHSCGHLGVDHANGSSDLFVTSILPSVPFTVPTPEMTFKKYLQYPSIKIQVVAQLLGSEKTHNSKIIGQRVATHGPECETGTLILSNIISTS
jgi:hypothetical protein